MMPLALLMKANTSLKKELWVVVGVLLFVLLMPLMALLSITNVGALARSFVPGSSSDGINPAGAAGATNISLYDGPSFPGDSYAFGNCTYWVFMRRAQVGEPIPTTWGNAATWAANAFLGGYTVNHTPTQYSIMQISDVDSGLGHVAFVESVDPDGTWHISEMNVVGFDETDDKALPASTAIDYEFIHLKEGSNNAN